MKVSFDITPAGGHLSQVKFRIGRQTVEPFSTALWCGETDAKKFIPLLSEHQCEGWLEGYLLTGRHGLFTSYEAIKSAPKSTPFAMSECFNEALGGSVDTNLIWTDRLPWEAPMLGAIYGGRLNFHGS